MTKPDATTGLGFRFSYIANRFDERLPRRCAFASLSAAAVYFQPPDAGPISRNGEPGMPTITLDGTPIEAKEGQTIIEAALDAGITIPHFCWHPGLSVAGNCRMCLVDVGMPARGRDGTLETDENGDPVIRYFPKLQIACATPIQDGMHVKLVDERVVEAQEAVMEFLLINHPLDCPICDEAGQCKLQEYGFRHSNGESRFVETKNHKDKRRPLGPNVLFDAERCISCSRCIRFADEYAEQPHLTFVQRGDHVTIETFPDRQFDSEYSMNVIEICPVGALTSPDFRFKARVWDMSFNDSICPGCSRGCNIQVGVRNNEIMRLEPRANASVNEYWMCDTGRLTQYKWVNENRIDRCLVKTNGSQSEVDWKDAVSAAAKALAGYKGNQIMVLASAHATNEANYALKKFAADVLGTKNVDYVRHIDDSFGDSKLRRNDRSPNAKGVETLGLKGGGAQALAEQIKSGAIKALYALEDDVAHWPAELLNACDNLDLLVVHASNHSALTAKADIVFSASTYAELEGTYTNFAGRVQHVAPVIVTAENERRMGMKMSRLDKFGAVNDRWTHGERRHCRPSWMPIAQLAQAMGSDFGFKRADQVFGEMAAKIGDFAAMDYAGLKQHRGIELGKGASPEPLRQEYDSHELKPN